MSSPEDDRRLVQTLESLGVETTWPPLRKLRLALRVVLDGLTVETARLESRPQHRASTLVGWVAEYRAVGRDTFLPPAPTSRATLEGMLSGRLVEEVWAQRSRVALPATLDLDDARDQDPDPGWDFELSAAGGGGAGGFTIDVKLHSEVFRESQRYAGLPPDDCVPLGIYKVLVARQRQEAGGSHHIYAFAFRPGLAADVRAQLRAVLSSDEDEALELLFHTSAQGKDRQQRRAVASVIARYYPDLARLLDGYEYRAISTRRATNLFLEKVEQRSPALGGRGRGFGGTINMHYSWSREMTEWPGVLHRAGHDLRGLLADFTQGRR